MRRTGPATVEFEQLAMKTEESRVAAAVRKLVDDYRARCLWFLREDYYPSTREERLRILEYIERHGDREAYRKAGAIRQWLLRNSSAKSAAS